MASTIKIDNNFYISVTGDNVSLVKEAKTGELNTKGNPVVSRNQWHYGNLGLALVKYMEEVEKNTESVGDIVTLNRQAKDQIIKSFGHLSAKDF